MLRSPLIALPLLIAAPAAAQEADSQLWTGGSASVDAGGGVELGIEGIARLSDADDGLYETELGGSAEVALGGGIALQAGYLRVTRHRGGRTISGENRTRVQLSATLGHFAGGTLSGRIRIEQRWRDGTDIGLRLRPQLRFTRPLGSGGPALILYHESFLGLNRTDWGQRPGYERMRNFAGVSTPLAKGLALEAGYINQYGFGRGGARDTMDHVASFSISLGL